MRHFMTEKTIEDFFIFFKERLAELKLENLKDIKLSEVQNLENGKMITESVSLIVEVLKK